MLEIIKQEHSNALKGIESLQAQLTFRFSVLSKKLDDQMATIAAREGLALLEYRVLATISAFGELSAADLCRYTAYDKAAISRTVNALIARGLIERFDDPAHGRRKILSLTKEGLEVVEALRPAVDARRENLSAALGARGEVAFKNAIETLVQYLESEASAKI